jgi:uncharacterized protein (DUF486 family)
MTPNTLVSPLQYHVLVSALLLTCSNLLMAFAWYGHLKPLQGCA